MRGWIFTLEAGLSLILVGWLLLLQPPVALQVGHQEGQQVRLAQDLADVIVKSDWKNLALKRDESLVTLASELALRAGDFCVGIWVDGEKLGGCDGGVVAERLLYDGERFVTLRVGLNWASG